LLPNWAKYRGSTTQVEAKPTRKSDIELLVLTITSIGVGWKGIGEDRKEGN